MNFKTTIVLLSVLIVLGAVAFFVQKGERSPDAAAPAEILIGQSTWRLVRDAVRAEPLSPVAAKGKAEPVAAWRVLAVDLSGPLIWWS